MNSSQTIFVSDRDLSALELSSHYRTGERDPVYGFYRPCLDSAVTYNRAVGYFRSSIFAIIGQPFLDFARRGGKARFICSPSITEEDAQAIASGYVQRNDAVEQAISRDIDALLSDPAAGHRAKLLATFIKFGALDIKVAIRSAGNGIYHEKIGVFDDGRGHQVSFLGSANETWSAWHTDGNHESIEVFRSWLPADEVRVKSHQKIFDLLWKGETPGVDTIDFPEAQHRKLLTAAAPGLDDPEIDPPHITGSRRRRLLPHQATAIELWEKAGRRGVFEHATGSGKTFTAIEAIKKHLATGEPAIVLVPSQLLHEQWKREILEEIPDASVLMAGGGHVKWKERGRLRSHTSPGLGMNRVTTAANVHDVTQAQNLLHGEETDVFADSGYRGVEKREEAKDLHVNWHIAMMPGKRRALNLETASGQLRSAAEKVKAGIRAKVEHPFRVIKCQFGFTKVRYRGLAKNTARLHTLFALSNLWMARRHLLQEMTG